MMLIMGILFLYGCIQLGKSLNLSRKELNGFYFLLVVHLFLLLLMVIIKFAITCLYGVLHY